MQTMLLQLPANSDRLWLRAAKRECIAYGDHGIVTETAADGRTHCFNCGGTL